MQKILENPWTHTGMTNIRALLYVNCMWIVYKNMCVFCWDSNLAWYLRKCAGGQGFLAGSRSGRDEAQLTDCLTSIAMCRAWRAKMISSDLLRLGLQREKKSCPDPMATLLIKGRTGSFWTFTGHIWTWTCNMLWQPRIATLSPFFWTASSRR